MSFIEKFENNFIKSNNNNDIVSFNELLILFNITRKELLNNLKKYNINYNAFNKNNNSIGCIYGYIKNKEEDINNIINQQSVNINYTQNIIYPHSILKNIDEIIKYSPIMIQKYKNTLFKYDNLNVLTPKQSEKYDLYKSYVSNTKLIQKIEKSINKRLIPLTNIIFKLYQPLYNNYEDELNNIDFENIKNDYYLSDYYNKYIILKNQSHKTKDMIETLNKINKYITENYEQSILNKKLIEQQNILNSINITSITQNDINNPSLDIIIKLIRYNDVCSDLYFDKEYCKKSILLYKMLIESIYNFHKYNELIDLYKKHNLPEDDYYYNMLIKLNERFNK